MVDLWAPESEVSVVLLAAERQSMENMSRENPPVNGRENDKSRHSASSPGLFLVAHKQYAEGRHKQGDNLRRPIQTASALVCDAGRDAQRRGACDGGKRDGRELADATRVW